MPQRDPSTREVANQIERAFAETPSPGEAFSEISATRQDEGIVDYFRGTTWRGHAVLDLRYHSAALSFFQPAALRYWLPAFMLGTLEDPETADVIPDSIAFGMRDDNTIALFTLPERRAIAAFFHELGRQYPSSGFEATAVRIDERCKEV